MADIKAKRKSTNKGTQQKRSLESGSGTEKKKLRKKKKRDLTKTPGLNKNLFSKIKQEFHDIDYADKLNPADSHWLSTFMEEDLGARLNHPNKKIYKKKQDKLECYRRNNKRNWDIYSINKAQGKIAEVSDLTKLDYLQNLETTNPEDAIIDLIDSTKKLIKNT